MEAAYATFLSGADEEYQPLLAELEKKIGNLSILIMQCMFTRLVAFLMHASVY